MSDIFDIDGQYRNNRNADSYKNHRNAWVSDEPVKSPKDPRLSRRDDRLKQFTRNDSSHQRTQHLASPTRDGGWQKNQMYNQNQHYQTSQSSMYSEQYNPGYGTTSGYDYQAYQQNRPDNFTQYSQSNYNTQGYNSGHSEPGPPGDDYPPGTWATSNYSTLSQPPPPQASSMATLNTYNEPMKDDQKKEAAIAQELKQQRATLIKQRDEYLRKASVLRRELEKLRVQKNELLLESSPPRESQRILRENAKLQLEIQNKLKSIRNVVDMLSGIIGDGLKWSEEEARSVGGDSDDGPKEEETAKYNYIHYDPELHWCRICDVFPSSAKDFLNHLHCNEHKLVTHEHQLVDTPWHKLPPDAEIPCTKGAPIKRIPIKGLQFFISAPAWYCKLCDVWIGDLHCASLHLKSKNHAHNYSNFVEQNPHWETNWLKDRETAYTRCLKQKTDMSVQQPESATGVSEKTKNRKNNKHGFLEGSAKDKKRKKKSKKRKKNSSASSSSTSSSSSNSSSEDEDGKAKSIRVAMRNKMRMQAQLILNEEIGGKLEALGKLVEERSRKIDDEKQTDTTNEDNIINQWMTVNPQNDKQIFDNLKGRLKQRQKADEGKAMEAAIEQRRKEREREERELRELREREQQEIEQKMRNEEGREREHEERERKESYRRKHRSESHSPESYNRRRSRSRSSNRRHYRSGPRSPDSYHEERKNDPYLQEREFKPRPKKIHEEEKEESTFDKHKSRTSFSSSSSNSRKLPFIGRMPLFKKKPESFVDGEKHHSGNKKRLDYQIRLSKFESGTTARAFIPEPGVVHITKLATPPSPNLKLSAENPPPPPQIIPEPPQISESPPPPPMINSIVTAVDETSVQDMELDEAVAPIPPGVPPSEAKPIVRPAGNHLPRDFQEALSIIYPTEQHPDYLAMQQDPNLMMQYQYQYQMMYSGMQMYDYANNHTDNSVPTSESKETVTNVDEEELKPPPPPEIDDKEDLAMLGIDEEDITAQNF